MMPESEHDDYNKIMSQALADRFVEAFAEYLHRIIQADFIAPAGYKDHLGMFAVSCFGCESLVKKYESEHDDYNKIMSQALADRFVEAFAEYLHRIIRTDMWGYAQGETLD